MHLPISDEVFQHLHLLCPSILIDLPLINIKDVLGSLFHLDEVFLSDKLLMAKNQSLINCLRNLKV